MTGGYLSDELAHLRALAIQLRSLHIGRSAETSIFSQKRSLIKTSDETSPDVQPVIYYRGSCFMSLIYLFSIFRVYVCFGFYLCVCLILGFLASKGKKVS